MAQLRQEYDQFLAKDVQILVVGPEDAEAFRQYFTGHDLPYPGLPDPKHAVLKLYGQEIKLFKLGRMPAQVLVDKRGAARFVHYGHSMSDITPNEDVLALVEQMEGGA